MTREEAINLETEVRYNLTASRHKEAVDLAFAALREQEERSKGCEFCKDGKSFIGQTILLGNDGFWRRIQFCPMCGRKLEVEG